MSVRFESMKRLLVTIAALGPAACAEHPSLRVDVVHPDDVTVATTTISVYESPLFSCEGVEFGDLSDNALAAAEVDQITVGAGLPADGLTMSRVDRKVIVARGYAQGGAYVSAGCEEKGVVGDNDKLTIKTELTASVSVNGIGLDDADPFGIVVTVVDPLVRSLADRIVSWRVHGADGATPFVNTNLTTGDDSDWVPAKPACSNDSGIVRVHPTPPATIGGFATTVRTSWSTEPPRTFSTFTPVDDSGREAITPIANSQRWCASRVSGNLRRLVCLIDDAGTPTAVDYIVTAADGGAQLAEGNRQPFGALPGGETVIGLFSIDRSALVRDVYALTSKARVIGAFGPSIASDLQPKLLLGEATDVAVLPACGATPPALLVLVQGAAARELRTLAVDPVKPLGTGASLIPYASPAVGLTEGLSINRTGCLAELKANNETIVHQVGVIDLTGRTAPGARNITAAFFDCASMTGTCSVPIVVPRAGVGFLPADDQHAERMVGTTFDASGTVLSVSVLQPDKNNVPRLVELERITAASFPLHVVAGQFDGDGRPDLFWDIPNINNGTSNFQLAYAHQVDGQRLSALSSTQQDLIVVDTVVADVTGDGLDDLVITSQDRVLSPTLHEVRVIPGQVPIKIFTPTSDPPCASK